MAQLCAQSITSLCEAPGSQAPTDRGERLALIRPFRPDKLVINGVSGGLSSASYDLHIGHDLTLGPDPGMVIHDYMQRCSSGAAAIEHAYMRINKSPPPNALAYSLEHFGIPHDVSAYIVDKSSYARRFTSAFNTLFDAGFKGVATLELVNHSGESIVIKKGDPICQIVFHWLDQPTDRPYDGKYQNQPARAVGPRFELEDGTYTEGTYPSDAGFPA